MGHHVGDTAFQNNSAAKDDVVAPTGLTLDPSVLLANDPGSATFVGFYDPSSPNAAVLSVQNGAITYDPSTNLITFNDPTVTQFDYIIRVGNGTFSWAHVTLAQHLGDELVQNWDFMSPAVPAGDSWTTASPLPSWGNDANGHGALEVISNAYLGAGMTGGDPANQSLDSQSSPGGVSVSQTISDISGGHIKLTVSVSAEEVISGGQTYDTTGGSVLKISWNGQTVITITEDDFRDPVTHAINYDAFKTFTADNLDAHGADTIGISDTGNGFAGYAVDWVSAKEWIV
jgi:hypothetical protein